MKKYHLLTGMQDLLPEELSTWQALESVLREWIALYAYGEIRTPILEMYELFARSVGEETDIVGKEMYRFVDQSEEQVVLRPEGTASVLRAVIEHNYLYNGPRKLWYYGPMFRRERPQKGRYRQFHQFGVEVLGFAKVQADIELLAMIYELWRRLGISDQITLQINTLGTYEERQRYRHSLISYLRTYASILDEDSRRRLTTNPLRILDSKNPALQRICEDSPKLIDSLVKNSPSLIFYDQLKEGLHALNIPYQENPRLVRGLDYYNHTVFEWVTDQLGSQATLCAGGRYNGLLSALGSKNDVPGTGFALGMERLVLLLQQQKNFSKPTTSYSQTKVKNTVFYLISQGDEALNKGLRYATMLRQKGWQIYIPFFSSQKMSSQFQKANKFGARYALIIGEEEVKNHVINIKDLTGRQGQREFEASGEPEMLSQALYQWIE